MRQDDETGQTMPGWSLVASWSHSRPALEPSTLVSRRLLVTLSPVERQWRQCCSPRDFMLAEVQLCSSSSGLSSSKHLEKQCVLHCTVIKCNKEGPINDLLSINQNCGGLAPAEGVGGLACSKMCNVALNNLAAHQNMLLYITRSIENKLELFIRIWHTEDFLKI